MTFYQLILIIIFDFILQQILQILQIFRNRQISIEYLIRKSEKSIKQPPVGGKSYNDLIVISIDGLKFKV